MMNPCAMLRQLSAIFDAEQGKESAQRAITDWVERVKQSGRSGQSHREDQL
jgi:hypothetical protein